MAQYKPCPICHGIKPELCEVCKGKGKFPYPWILPEDQPIRKRWTTEETCVIYSADCPHEAYYRYVFVYGSMERTYSSIYRHWQYTHKSPVKHPHWTIAEDELITQYDTATEAALNYLLEYGTVRSDGAVRAHYYRVTVSSKSTII